MMLVICPTPPSDTVVMLWNMAPFKPEVGTSIAFANCTLELVLKLQ